jgi:CDGSH-type Zn-finger protein
MANGPVVLTGPVVVKDAAGAVLREADRVALCRCGASATKPFCDGAHARNGFRAP